ncbi:hypothetical protein D3C86_1954900 [compost metagenome]
MESNASDITDNLKTALEAAQLNRTYIIVYLISGDVRRNFNYIVNAEIGMFVFLLRPGPQVFFGTVFGMSGYYKLAAAALN